MANYNPAVNRIDDSEIIGHKFGRFLVISEVPKEDRKSSFVREFYCLCDCGKIVRVRKPNLFSGNSLSCGCLAKELQHQKAVDYFIGRRFDRLVGVRESDTSKPYKMRILCLCDCGNYKDISANDLRTGMVRSCGCLKREIIKKRNTEDLTGQTFFELTAIKQVDNFIGSTGITRVQWLWQCSCGMLVVAMPMNVKRGMTKSCGHLGKSEAEFRIFKFLHENNIVFKKDEYFDECVNPETNHPLCFDFVCLSPTGKMFIIEHQGEQHFYTKGKRASNNFGKLQREVTDKIKREYCAIHNIPLYETLYNEDYIAHLSSILQENGYLLDAS